MIGMDCMAAIRTGLAQRFNHLHWSGRGVGTWLPCSCLTQFRRLILRSYRKRFWGLAACLAGLAGYVDVLGFVKLGGFFVSFMSGNSTRLAFGMARDPSAALLAAQIVVAFVLGVMLGTFLSAVGGDRRKPLVLSLVALMLAIAALVDAGGVGVWSALALAAAMGAENAVFLRNGEVSVGLTYMTGTLVKFGQRSVSAMMGEDRWGWLPYLILWCSFVGGAVLGAFCQSLGPIAIWIASGFALLMAAYAAAIGPAASMTSSV